LRGCVHVDQRQAPNTCATNSFLAPHRLWHLLGDARGAPLTLYSGVFDEMQHVPLAMMDFFSASAPIMMLAFSLLHRTTLGGGRYAAAGDTLQVSLHPGTHPLCLDHTAYLSLYIPIMQHSVLQMPLHAPVTRRGVLDITAYHCSRASSCISMRPPL